MGLGDLMWCLEGLSIIWIFGIIINEFDKEEVVLNLLNTKCMSAMLYGTEACPVMSRHKHSFDFAVNRVFMKILHTGSKQTVEECQKYFGC